MGALAVVLSPFVVAAAGALLLNKPVITIKMNGKETVHAEAGVYYSDLGAKAYRHGSIFRFPKKEVELQTMSNVNTSELGTYTIEYSAADEKCSASVTRKVIVEDTQPPVITLTTDPDHYTLPGHTYEEEGIRIVDVYDGDLTDKVTMEEKDGKVIYTVSDASGNTATAEREIVYDDRKGPVISFEDGEDVIYRIGSGDFEDLFTAVDDLDGDVTSSVSVDGYVDTSSVGDYTLTYKVKDSYGNETTAVRTVHVQKASANTGPEDGKTIYLTFDDGPSIYTQELLDVLAKYNVQVTFFVVNGGGMPEMIAKEAAGGHTIAVHSLTHAYDWIYSSTDAYWGDFNEMNQIIKDQTGSYTTLFRFPGGSSNTVSANYSSGIMTRLAEQAASKGYEYFDWNVSSGDAGATTDTNEIIQNVIGGIENNSQWDVPSVVLQHDSKGYSVAAVEEIIKWGLKNGYNFRGLQPGSYHAKHGISN